VAATGQRELFLTGPVLSNGVHIFSEKIELPVVELIICDAIECDFYSTGEEITKMLEPDFL
jgi:hypothetical protein